MITKLTEEEFNEFAIHHPNSIFFQSSYWGKLKQSTGWIPHLVGLKENNKITSATLLLAKKIPIFNRYIYYAPRGFLTDYSDYEQLDKFILEIKNYVKANKGIFVKMNPLIIYQERDTDGNIVENGINNKKLVEHLKKLGFDYNGLTIHYGKDLEPRWISVLDLRNKTMDDVKKNLRSTTRWDINNSYKHGLRLQEIDETRMDEFKKLMEHTGERRGFIDRPLSYYQEMYKNFKEYIKVMLVELNIDDNIKAYQEKKELAIKKLKKEEQKDRKKDGLLKELQKQIDSADRKIKESEEIQKKYGTNIVVAGGLFMTFGKQVVSLFGASYKEFMKYKGQYFLNNEMIKYAIDNNYDAYNFYGITGEFNEDSPMFGLFDFKRGFGAHVEELIGEFTLITNSFYYHIYQLMFKVYKILKKVKK